MAEKKASTTKEPKTKTIRITDKQYTQLFEATTEVQTAQALQRRVVAGVFAAHDMDPCQIVHDGQDEQGRFLVVQIGD